MRKGVAFEIGADQSLLSPQSLECGKVEHSGDTNAPACVDLLRDVGLCEPVVATAGLSEQRRVMTLPKIIRLIGLELLFLQDKGDTKGSLTAFEMTVHPNARMPVAHYHESWDETVYGLKGQVVWRVDGEDIRITPGDCVFIPRGIVHAFRNESEAVGTCLCIVTPGVLGSDYFEEIAAVIGAGPPDPAKMKQVMLRHGLVPAP